MTEKQFIDHIRSTHATGREEIRAELLSKFRNCRFITICRYRSINVHSLWIYSAKKGKLLGRAYLGSTNLSRDLEGWHKRIKCFF